MNVDVSYIFGCTEYDKKDDMKKIIDIHSPKAERLAPPTLSMALHR